LSQDFGFGLNEDELEKILDDPTNEMRKGGGVGSGNSAAENE
jgi:hypothetical protein